MSNVTVDGKSKENELPVALSSKKLSIPPGAIPRGVNFILGGSAG